MDQGSVYMVAALKVPMLKPGEYELWRMRMEQYLQMIDYSLWEVIKNGNAPRITKVVEGVETTTAKEKAQRRLELKARSTLLMVIPNEHQLKCLTPSKMPSHYCTAVEKHRVLNPNHDRLHSLLVSWRFMVKVSHKKVWNRSSYDVMIYEPEVKRTSSSISNTQNVAFVSSNSTSSTNEVVNTAHGATTVALSYAVNSTSIDNLCDDCYQLPQKGDSLQGSARLPRKPRNRNGRTQEGCAVETTTSNALVSCDGSSSD
ncbi:hypothetical protein Tco_0920124 [Tanacetum coccineum]